MDESTLKNNSDQHSAAFVLPLGWHLYYGTPSNQIHAKDCPTCKALREKAAKS